MPSPKWLPSCFSLNVLRELSRATTACLRSLPALTGWYWRGDWCMQTVNTETTCTWAAPWARAKHHWKINKHLTLFFTENTRRSDMLRLRNIWQLLYGNETNNWWVAKLNPRKYVLFFWSPNSGRQITKCQAPCGDTTEWSVVFAAHSDSLSWTGRYCWW